SPQLPPPPTSTLLPYTTLFRSFKLQMWTAWHYQMERLHLDWVLPNAEHIAFRFDGKDCQDCEYRYNESTQNEREACKKERTRNRSDEHTSELQSRFDLVCRLLL